MLCWCSLVEHNSHEMNADPWRVGSCWFTLAEKSLVMFLPYRKTVSNSEWENICDSILSCHQDIFKTSCRSYVLPQAARWILSLDIGISKFCSPERPSLGSTRHMPVSERRNSNAWSNRSILNRFCLHFHVRDGSTNYSFWIHNFSGSKMSCSKMGISYGQKI